MIPRFKYRPLLIGFSALVSLAAIFLMVRSRSPESRFKDLFADLSIGTPGYQTLFEVTHPSFTLKGDYCTLDFIQSSNQFHEFIVKIGASETSILSSSGVWIRADSKINPKYPWMLLVRADNTNTSDKVYRVHIEGHQPYD